MDNNWFIDMLSNDGKVSMMRFLSLICILCGITCFFLGGFLHNNEFLIGGGSLIGAGFTGKAVQKFKEQ